jgi:hypothetical protein
LAALVFVLLPSSAPSSFFLDFRGFFVGGPSLFGLLGSSGCLRLRAGLGAFGSFSFLDLGGALGSFGFLGLGVALGSFGFLGLGVALGSFSFFGRAVLLVRSDPRCNTRFS